MNVKANSGEIWIHAGSTAEQIQPIEIKTEKNGSMTVPEKPISIPKKEETEKESSTPVRSKTYEEMTVEELQEAILCRMKQNGPVTEQMKKDVYDNVYHDSLVTWIKSFN